MPLTREPTEPLELIAVDDLRPWERNARTHSRKQVRQVARSIEKFGFTNPVLIDENNCILAGHGRVEAAKLLNMKFVPCRRLAEMSATEKRAYVIADNKLALNAGWDEQLLADELHGLLEIDPEFDLTLTGFAIPEIDALVDNLEPVEPGDPADDALPEVQDIKTRCRLGDIVALGRHRLICGDATDSQTVATLMNGELADMVFTDPPYNVRIDGHVSGLGATKHREFAMAAGEMSPAQFADFLYASFTQLVRHSRDGSIHFICMDWRHLQEIMQAGTAAFTELKNLIVWVKDNGGMGTFYRSRHELIFVFKNGTAPHVNAFELGQHGRYRTNCWQYKGVNSMSATRQEELELHPTTKPAQMIADAIKDVSPRGGVVLDLFGGSGSTLIGAEKTGRRAYICELDPTYCDRIIARWEAYAKDDAELIACGLPDMGVPAKERAGRKTLKRRRR
jgi:DNA modification methylase